MKIATTNIRKQKHFRTISFHFQREFMPLKNERRVHICFISRSRSVQTICFIKLIEAFPSGRKKNTYRHSNTPNLEGKRKKNSLSVQFRYGVNRFELKTRINWIECERKNNDQRR